MAYRYSYVHAILMYDFNSSLDAKYDRIDFHCFYIILYRDTKVFSSCAHQVVTEMLSS